MAKETTEINPPGIRLSRKSAKPLYAQLYEQLRQKILQKMLRPGDRIPASRNLAMHLKVSRVIVSQAYEQLMMEGYLEGRMGSGTFIAIELPDELLQAQQQQSIAKPKTIKNISIHRNAMPSAYAEKMNIVPFQMGTPSLDFFPYKLWQQAGNKILKDFKQAHLGYDDVAGHLPLRQAIADYLRLSRAVNCEADQVIIVTGSQQGLNLVTSCLLQKGDKVWMEDPGYFGAKISFSNAQVKLCPVPIQRDGLDIAYAKQHYPDAKLAYLTPSHQFPLGHTLSHSKRLELLAWAQEHDMWLLEDDYDSEYRYSGEPLPSVQGLDTNGRVIYSGTFSKVLFPGLRLAYLVLPDTGMVAAFKKVKENIDRQSPIMEQLILTEFIKSGHFVRHIRRMRLLYAERQAILISSIREQLGELVTLDPAPSGMHLICWLPSNISITKLNEEIARTNLVVSYVKEYTISHQHPPGLMLGFTAFSKYRLKQGVEKMAAAIKAALA